MVLLVQLFCPLISSATAIVYLLTKCTRTFNSSAEMSTHLVVFLVDIVHGEFKFIALFTSEACSKMQSQVVDVGKQVQMPKGDEQYAQELSDIRGKIQVRLFIQQ